MSDESIWPRLEEAAKNERKAANIEKAMVASERRRKNAENAIDLAMQRAFETLQILCSQEDPYAMAKAVETIPIPVLIEIIRKRTVQALEVTPLAEVTPEANDQ